MQEVLPTGAQYLRKALSKCWRVVWRSHHCCSRRAAEPFISINTPSVAHCRYALEQAPLAFQALESRQVIGKLLLLLGGAPKAHSRL